MIPNSSSPYKIGIIGGNGLMGQIFTDFFLSQNLQVLISDLNTKLTNQDLAKQVDICIVSVPIEHTSAVIEEIIPYLRPSTLLCDLTSIKIPAIQSMQKFSGEYCGFHPMFGKTSSLKNQKIIYIPGRQGEKSIFLKNLFVKSGFDLKEMPADAHDKLMSLVQVLVHFADITFANSLSKTGVPLRDFLDFSSPPSELKISFAARILAQNPALYGAMQIFNDQSLAIISEFEQSISELKQIITNQDLNGFNQYFKITADFLGDYKERAMTETNWIISQVLENRRKQNLRQQLGAKASPKISQIITLGPANSYSHLTSLNLQNKKILPTAEISFATQIEDVFEAVQTGKSKYGIVPIENSLHGSVRETYDCLIKYPLVINSLIKTEISHCLVGIDQDIPLDQVIMVASHDQALNQCRAFLRQHLPQAELKSFPSTSAAMEFTKKQADPAVLSIGSFQGAQNLGLKIITDRISDSDQNSTNFVLLTQKPLKLEHGSNFTTSIAFSFSADQSGNLSQVLNVIGKHGVNLTKIESRPSKKTMGDYYFYLNMSGKLTDSAIQSAIAEIKTLVDQFFILGSYSEI